MVLGHEHIRIDQRKTRKQLFEALLNLELVEVEREARTVGDLSEKKQAYGALLRFVCRMRDLAMNQVAQLSRIDHGTISRIKSAERKPRKSTVKALANALNVPAWQLYPKQVFEPKKPESEREEDESKETEQQSV